MLRNVYLEGELGDKFMPHMQIQCDTVADVFRCLDANFEGVKNYFVEKEQNNIGYEIHVAKQKITDEREMLMEVGEGDIIISPIPAGSGDIGKIIVGTIIAIVGIMVGNPQLIAMGVNIALAGIQGLLAPDPAEDEPEQESYLFQGTAQVIAQGAPVPVLYGRLRVPGQPISMELRGGTANYGNVTGHEIPGLQGNSSGPVAQALESDGSDHLDTNFPVLSEANLGPLVTEGILNYTGGAAGRQSGGKT